MNTSLGQGPKRWCQFALHDAAGVEQWLAGLGLMEVVTHRLSRFV